MTTKTKKTTTKTSRPEDLLKKLPPGFQMGKSTTTAEHRNLFYRAIGELIAEQLHFDTGGEGEIRIKSLIDSFGSGLSGQTLNAARRRLAEVIQAEQLIEETDPQKLADAKADAAEKLVQARDELREAQEKARLAQAEQAQAAEALERFNRAEDMLRNPDIHHRGGSLGGFVAGNTGSLVTPAYRHSRRLRNKPELSSVAD